MIPRPAAFLDRDGTLNVDRGYVHRVEDLEWIPGAPEAVTMLRDAGFAIVIVTNQSGIGRGMFSPETYSTFEAEFLARFPAKVDAVYHCPHWPERDGVCACRKPAPGMLERAFRELPLVREGSLLIGDAERDVEAARRAGVEGWLFPGGRLDEFVARVLYSRR